MTDSHEPSYYEIALTQRQVLTVFVILLVCVVTAFFSGVWVGRQAGGIPVETVAAETISAGVAPGEAPLEELRFFSREAEAETPAVEPAPVAPVDPDPEPPRPPVTEPASRPAARPAPAPPAPAPEPEPAGPPPERKESPPPPAAAAAGGAEEILVVQVFSSNDRAQAQRVVDRLRAGGYPALLSPVAVRDQTMYRVRVGPYRERQEAQAVADRVRRDFKLDTWITR